MKWREQDGFTFIEVMVAMLIFVLAVLAAVNIVNGAVRATRETREITVATWLLQNVMSELEIKLETQGIDQACEKKAEGKFEAPYEKYSWQTNCYEIDFKLQDTASKLADQSVTEEDQQNSQTNMIKTLVLDSASTYISKSLRELHAEVYWTQGATKRTIDLTTHFARYDTLVTVPGLSK